jgi:hypothetical protein
MSSTHQPKMLEEVFTLFTKLTGYKTGQGRFRPWHQAYTG